MENVSIIIPVFNTIQTLEKCFQSIIRQTWNDYKVIIIDDGSTDGSYELCKKFAVKDKRFHVILNTTSQHGPSQARNLGLAKINTKFVTFIDSDDWIEPKHLQYLMENIGETDICSIGWTKKEVPSTDNLVIADTMTRDEYITKALGMKRVSGYLCNKLFKTQIIVKHNLCLDVSTSSSEDLLFSINYLQYIQKGKLIMSPATYHYISRQDSLTQSKAQSKTEIFAELRTVAKIKTILDVANIDVPFALNAHYVKTYLNTFLEIHDNSGKQSAKFKKIERSLRMKMLQLSINYLTSNEFTTKSKVQVMIVIFCPLLRDWIVTLKKRLRRK